MTQVNQDFLRHTFQDVKGIKLEREHENHRKTKGCNLWICGNKHRIVFKHWELTTSSRDVETHQAYKPGRTCIGVVGK